MKDKKVIFFLLLTIAAHLFLFLAKNYFPPTKSLDGLEQEHFLTYVKSLKGGSFPRDLEFINTRFFPGLPFTILVFSYVTGNLALAGLAVIFISITLIYLISLRLTKNPFYSFWITVFPPIVYEQTAKISIEVLLIAIFIAVYFLFSRKKYLYASILAGFGTLVRPVALFIYLPILIYLLRKRETKLLLQSIFLFLIFPLLFFVFNIKIFGNIFYQAGVYSTADKASIPILQLFTNLYSYTVNAKWRMLVSGLAYLLFSIFLLFKILKKRSDFVTRNDNQFLKIWAIGAFLYVNLVIPIQFLSEVGRYLSSFFPLALLVNYKFFLKNKTILFIGILMMIIAFI
jgi:hypothetical protein